MSQSELVCESTAVESLDIENQSLKRQLSELQDGEQGVKVNLLQAEVERLAQVSLVTLKAYNFCQDCPISKLKYAFSSSLPK